MKFQPFVQDQNNWTPTHKVGAIDVSYAELVLAFGEPHQGVSPDNKCDAQWTLLFENGVLATIYNYKDGVAYMGKRHGIPTEKLRDWHIGGISDAAVVCVKDVLRAITPLLVYGDKVHAIELTTAELSHIKECLGVSLDEYGFNTEIAALYEKIEGLLEG